MRLSECEKLASVLRSIGKTMCCAESCTGGMVSASMTDMPGSSEYFLGGAVVYSNESKVRVLGVSESTLAEHGAVSAETASEMAIGAVALYRSDYSVAVTGIAGPGGGTEVKPVGLVYISVSDGSRSVTTKNLFDGDRQQVRESTVREACAVLRDFIEGIL